MKRKIVYIAHPIANDVENNMRSLREKLVYLFDHHPEIVPFAPYYVYVDSLSESDRLKGMHANFEILRSGMVNEMWLMGDHISKGMREEIGIAIEMNIPVVYKLDSSINKCMGETEKPKASFVTISPELEKKIEELRSINHGWFEKYCSQEKEINEVKETNVLLNKTVNELRYSLNSARPDDMTVKYLKSAIENAELKNQNSQLIKEAEQKKEALQDWMDKYKLAQEQGAEHSKRAEYFYKMLKSIQDKLNKEIVIESI